MKVALVIVVAVSVLAAQCSAAGQLGVADDGSLDVVVPGKEVISSTLFVHYGRWVYRSAEQVTRTGAQSWSGVITKREQDGPGGIRFTQTALRDGDALRLEFAFERDGEMDLRRGVMVAIHFPYPDFAGGGIVFSHGPPASTSRMFEVAARSCTVNLSETEALEISCPRANKFSTWISESSFSLNVQVSPREFDRAATGSVTLRLVPAARAVDSWKARPQNQPLRLGGARADRQTVGRYAPIEFTLDLSATYENPFDPDQVRVEATFRTPSGATERLPGFYYQPFSAEYENGYELLSAAGDPAWKVRYTPRETGNYRVTFRARDAGGEVSSDPVSFRCVESKEPGFIRISDRRRSGPRYFGFDEGGTLFLIGHNVTTYAADLDDVFRKMSAGGENYTRFWMWSRGLGLELGLPVGHYRMAEAWRLDRTLELARRHGVYLMLCLDTHQDFIGGWRSNPYNAAVGGPCEEVMDFFTNEDARSLYKKRLRYLVARWGHHPNLLCWEFGNEMEGWPGAQQNRELVARWHAEMARFVGELDPFDHPITSSLWTTEGWPELWNLPEMEFVQSHFYSNNRWADMAGDVAAICKQKLADYPEKLHVFGEYGVSSGAGTRQMDPGGIHLHNGNWAALMSGCASNPVSWWHDSYIDPLDLYRVYRGIARFVEGERLADRAWQPVEVESIAYAKPLAQVIYTDLQFRGARGSWTAAIPEGTRFVVRRDGSVENINELQDLLHGRGHPDLRSPFVFEVDCRRPCRFSVHVGTVSSGGVLDFQVDGQTVRTVELPTGEDLGRESEWQEQWSIWQTRYDEPFAIEVPAGRHTIKLENHGNDWVQINYFRLEDYVTNERPPLRVLGLVSHDRALLWAQSKAHTWFNAREGNPMPPVEATVAQLKGFAEGRWQVEFWDTVKGEVVAESAATAKDGLLELELPAVETDLALKLSR